MTQQEKLDLLIEKATVISIKQQELEQHLVALSERIDHCETIQQNTKASLDEIREWLKTRLSPALH